METFPWNAKPVSIEKWPNYSLSPYLKQNPFCQEIIKKHIKFSCDIKMYMYLRDFLIDEIQGKSVDGIRSIRLEEAMEEMKELLNNYTLEVEEEIAEKDEEIRLLEEEAEIQFIDADVDAVYRKVLFQGNVRISFYDPIPFLLIDEMEEIFEYELDNVKCRNFDTSDVYHSSCDIPTCLRPPYLRKQDWCLSTGPEFTKKDIEIIRRYRDGFNKMLFQCSSFYNKFEIGSKERKTILRKEKKRIKEIGDLPILSTKVRTMVPDETTEECSFVYLVHVHTDLYKLGQTKTNGSRPKKAYPPGSECVRLVTVIDRFAVENDLKLTFGKKFRSGGGYEWFHGREEDILNTFDFVVGLTLDDPDHPKPN